MKLEIYEDTANRFRWRLRAANHRIVGESGQGFSTRKQCARSARALGLARGEKRRDGAGARRRSAG